MSKAHKYFAGIAVAALAVGSALALGGQGAGATALTGTWSLDAPSTTTGPVTSNVYTAAIQQPINADNSSVWPAKRGVIPVQFTVTQAFKTTTTTSYTFESLLGHVWPDPASYSDVAFTPASATVADLQSLSANYAFTIGTNHGGSLRWSVSTPLGEIFVYYGDEPNFTGDPAQSGVNMIADPTDVRVDTTQVGGTFYDTWAHALVLAGSQRVNYAALVVDGGWGGDQVLNLTSAEVNGNVDSNPTVSTSTSTTTTPVQTNAPAAILHLVKTSGLGTGSIDETLVTSAQGDSGGNFRQVDGKYIYNLDVTSLSGVGKYQAYINIGGDIAQPGIFGLK
jgi:hypothetical protein